MQDGTLRRDAAENRDRLLRAGREIFAERGFDATLNDVAHHARVGVGTAYRRFANKAELIDAIRKQQDDELVAVLDEALGIRDPWESIVHYMETSLTLHTRDRGMAQMLSGRYVHPDKHDESRDRIAPLHNELARRARESGAVHEWVRGTDLVFILIGCIGISNAVHEGSPVPGRDDIDELYRRYLAVSLNGLRPEPRDPFTPPVRALSTDDLHTLLRGRAEGD